MGTRFSTTALAGYTNTKFPATSDETAKGHVTPTGMRAAINVEDGADVTDATNVEAAGAAMVANDLSDLNDAATARTNLGLGSAATTNTTAYATAAQGTTADAALPAASVLDEDDFATDSATLPPSQQSTAVYTEATALAYAQAVSRATFYADMGDGGESNGSAGTGGNIVTVSGRMYNEIRSGTTVDNTAYRNVGLPSRPGLTDQWNELNYSLSEDLQVTQIIQPALISDGSVGSVPTEIYWGIGASSVNNTARYADWDLTDASHNAMLRAEIRNDTVYLTALFGGVKSEAGGTVTIASGDIVTLYLDFVSGESANLYVNDGTTIELAATLEDNGTTVLVPASSGYFPALMLAAKTSPDGDECRVRYNNKAVIYSPDNFFLAP